MMQTLWQDLSLAARLLSKSPGFTCAAALTLALGIGANATIFSFADAVLLRPLPVPDADRIVHVYQRRPGRVDRFPLAYADYRDYRRESQSFEELAAHYPTSPMHLVIDDEPYSANGAVVTATYFDVLRLLPAYGRFFTPEEDRVPDRDAVAVIGHALWHRKFGGTSDVLGRTIHINDHEFTIVGVTPPGFTGVHNGGVATEVWIPTAMFRIGYRFCDGFTRACTIVDMLGKLRAGVAITQAQHELDAIAARLAAAYPETNSDLGVRIVAARGRGYGIDQNSGDVQQLRVLVAAVAVVLLIACANIAGLLLARAIRRRKEIAIRLAIGATRSRLVRQLFTESAVIGAVGTIAGIVLAFWAKDVVGTLDATDYAGRPQVLQTELSRTVLAATITLTAIATVIFGLVPALQASKPDVLPALKDEGASGGATRARLRHLLVVGQIALAVTLLIGAALLVRSVNKVLAGPGFDPRPVITVRLRPALVNYPTERALAFQRQVIATLESLPGVVRASPADLPATGPATPGISERQTRVGPRYFATLGVPLIEGREFDERDSATAPRRVVINDVMAKRIAEGQPVAGRTLLLDKQPYEIIGVVKDAQYYATGLTPHAVIYRSYWQPNADGSFNRDSRTIVRVAGDAAAMMPAIRRAIATVDPAVPISEDYPLSQRVKYEFQTIERARTLFTTFAGLALLLAAVGLYSVLAFTVGQRTREIGVRMALGASQRDVAGLVFRDGINMAVTGTVLGLATAWLAAKLVASLLYGVDTRDAAAFLTAPALSIAVALVACYFPARRASRVSPLNALKYE